MRASTCVRPHGFARPRVRGASYGDAILVAHALAERQEASAVAEAAP